MRTATLFAVVVSLCIPPGVLGQNPPPNNTPVLSPLTLVVTGNGSIIPNLNGRLLRVGKAYTITARPGPGHVFSHWAGVAASIKTTLRFVMQSNLVLEAHFVSNPFLSLKGPYAGLFYEGGAVTFTNSGLFTATLTDRGGISVKLRLAGKPYSSSGQFTAWGTFSNSIPRLGLPPLSVQLQLDFTGSQQMVGSVRDGFWAAALTANRNTFSRTNPAPVGGKRYTLVMGPTANSPLIPGGTGFGTVTVDLSGNVRFAGTLGEGTQCSQSSFVSKAATWPLFAAMPYARGSILGWMAFTNEAISDLRGRLSWFKVPYAPSTYYPEGFELSEALEAVGSQYAYTWGTPLLNLPTNGGVVVLEQGILPQSLTNGFTLNTNNRVAGSNRLSLTISTASGLFSGTATDPANGPRVSIKGALLVKQNAGFGYFPGIRGTGPLYLGPEMDPALPPPVVTLAATEGDASESGANSGAFTVSRTGSTASKLTVAYSIGGTAENGTDYAELSGSVTIPPASASATVTLRPMNDAASEGEESVALMLAPGAGYSIGAGASASVTIADGDPPPPTVTVMASDENASEKGTDPGTFTVNRTGSLESQLIVAYSVAGAAVNSVDYATLSGSVTIPPASTSATVLVTPIDDANTEVDESVVLTLTAPPGYQVGQPSTASVTISDNDAVPPTATNFPSAVLNLNNWKLTLPVETARKGNPDEILQPELARFVDTNYFRVNDTTNGVVFAAPCGGATSIGSSYPRTELREMIANGGGNASWSTTWGTHTMTITQAITHLPEVKPHMVAGQIHNARDEVIVFRLEGKKLFIETNGVNGPVLTTNYRLGDVFTAKFIARNGGVECYYNDQHVHTYSVDAIGCYFKAGCYTQSNTNRGDAPTAYGEVVIHGLSVSHQ